MPSHTKGPWEVFVCDDGKEWTGWPLSISAEGIEDKCVVRPGGFYPYRWDANTSQAEALANAALISAAPCMLKELGDLLKAANLNEEQKARIRRVLEKASKV